MLVGTFMLYVQACPGKSLSALNVGKFCLILMVILPLYLGWFFHVIGPLMFMYTERYISHMWPFS